MSTIYRNTCRALLRLGSVALLRSYDRSSLALKSGFCFRSTASHRALIDSEPLIHLPLHSHHPKGTTADFNVNQHYARTRHPSRDGSSTPNSDTLHVNTRDILTVDWQRHAVQQAVQDARDLIEKCEEDITKSERRLAEVSIRANKVANEGTLEIRGSVWKDNAVDGFRTKGSEPDVNGHSHRRDVFDKKDSEASTGIVNT